MEHDIDFRDILSDIKQDFREMAGILADLKDRMIRVETTIGQIANEQNKQDDWESRLVVLETHVETIISQTEQKIVANRWWTGIAVTVTTVVIPALYNFLQHLHLIK